MKKLLALVLLAAACGGPPYRAHEKDPEKLSTIDTTHLVALDDEAKWAFELQDHRAQVLPDGRLKAQLRLVNVTPREQHVQICWTFKDDRNFAVEPDTPFEHRIIQAGQTLDLSQTSMKSGPTDFSVQIKTAEAGEL